VSVPEPDAAALRRVRDVFDAAGYTDGGLAELLGVDLPPRLGAARLPALLRRTAGGTPRELLVRLFVLGVAVGEDGARRAVAPMEPEAWQQVGLLERCPGGWRAAVQVRCFQGLRVASDFGVELRGPVGPEFVMAISPSTISLAGLTVRRPAGSALDIGAGAGLQAFLAAAHSRRVVAVDRNPRAVALARLNASLNDLDGVVDCREGDLFEPVTGERFELIVSNPPFVIAPAFRYYYLHSGLPGDEICRRILRTAPSFLTPGGFCHVAANWAVRPGQEWAEPVAGWLDGLGCDVWVLGNGVHGAGAYAADWAEPSGTTGGPDSLRAAVEEALAAFESLGIEAVAGGVVTLRRRDGAVGGTWFRADESPGSMAYPCGDDVARVFAAQDALAALAEDRDLLGCRLRVAPDVRLHQSARPEAGRWSPVEWELERTDGLRWRGGIDEPGATLVARCDGEAVLGTLLADLAAAAGLDVDAVVSRSLPAVRRLVEQGFLVGDLDVSRPGPA
jgi:SAM-dependent methyltransferase